MGAQRHEQDVGCENAVCRAVQPRIFELRRLGYNIENRTERVAGLRHSWFRLVTTPLQEKPPVPASPNESDFMRRRREERAAATPLWFAQVLE